MSEVKWIKLTTTLPDNKKIKRIRRLPDGNNVILIWVFILARAGESNKKGGLFLTDDIPYTELDLAEDWNFTVEMIRFALITLEQYGMIEIFDGVIFIKNWEEYQQLDALEKIKLQNRKRQKKYMEKQKQLAISTNVSDDVITNVSANDEITANNATDIDIDIDIDLDIEKHEDDVSAVAESTPPEKWLSLEIWEQNNGFPNMVVMEDMKILTKEIGDELLAYAIRETAIREIRGKGTWKYVESIVNNWKKLSLDTVEKVKQYQARREMDQQNQRNKKFGNQSPRKETMPEWAEKEVKETPMSPEEQAEWEARLRNRVTE